MRSILLISMLLCGMMWSSCNVINPKEKIPTYVHIDSFTYKNTNPQVFGTSSHKITNVWAYIDNQSIGEFELPATFPVLLDSAGRLELSPGIDMNGFSYLRAQYPFYNYDTSFILKAQPGKIVQVNPVTSYTSIAKVLWQENFDNPNARPFAKYDGDTGMTRTSDPTQVFEGTGSGYIYMKGANVTSSNEATGSPSFPTTAAQAIYLELNYKCSVPFIVGLEVTLTSTGEVYREYLSGLNAHPDSWNKAYLNLQDFVNAYRGTDYRIIIQSGNTADSTTAGYVLLDNLKVISY